VSSSNTEIVRLDSIVAALPPAERKLFERIYELNIAGGQLRIPDSMKPWIEEHFGSVSRVLNQRIVRITNRITLEEAFYNQLRAGRPLGRTLVYKGRDTLIREPGFDSFHSPLTDTPEDAFGRVKGRYCVTASNIAKYEGYHGVVIFDEHDPLNFAREQLADYIDTGLRWARSAHAEDPSARYFFFMWNCGARAGASLRHGHAQVMLGRNRHYSRIEQLRLASLRYNSEYDSSYFDDLCRIHRALGCGFNSEGVDVLAYLTPVKEKEVILLSGELGEPLVDRLYEVLACFRDRMGVTSFNVALWLPPIAQVKEDWGGFPSIARVVDRGDETSGVSDVGTMELYAASVISSDPFEVARIVKQSLENSAN